MKRFGLYATILLAVLAVASCYWRPNSGSGGIRVDVSGLAPKDVGDVVRVYLIADGLLFSTGGAPFAAEISGESFTDKIISITGLPVGPVYKAMVGWGQLTDGLFYPRYVGESELFTITPDGDTAVPVNTDIMPYNGGEISFSTELLGRSFTGLLDDTYYIYAAEASRTYYIYKDSGTTPTWYIQDSYDLAVDPAGSGVSSVRINGLSKGDYVYGSSYYLDGNAGILPFQGGEGWYFETIFSQTLGGSRDLLQSGSFAVPSTTDYAVFFRRSGGLGGSYVPYLSSSDPSAWQWRNVDVSGVSDMAISQYNAYYAAGGKVFALRPGFLQDATPTLAEYRIDIPVPVSVRSLGFRRYVSGSAGGTLYLGTTDGIWQVDVDESASAPYATPLSPVQVTSGDSIERVAISSYHTTREAYLSRYYLYIVNGGAVDTIPFFAVVPGRATDLVWAYDSLYLSGSEGLSAVYIGS